MDDEQTPAPVAPQGDDQMPATDPGVDTGSDEGAAPAPSEGEEAPAPEAPEAPVEGDEEAGSDDAPTQDPASGSF